MPVRVSVINQLALMCHLSLTVGLSTPRQWNDVSCCVIRAIWSICIFLNIWIALTKSCYIKGQRSLSQAHQNFGSDRCRILSRTSCLNSYNHVPNCCIGRHWHSKHHVLGKSIEMFRISSLVLQSKGPVFWGMGWIWMFALLYRMSSQHRFFRPLERPKYACASKAVQPQVNYRGELWLVEMSGQSYNLSLCILRGEKTEWLNGSTDIKFSLRYNLHIGVFDCPLLDLLRLKIYAWFFGILPFSYSPIQSSVLNCCSLHSNESYLKHPWRP